MAAASRRRDILPSGATTITPTKTRFSPGGAPSSSRQAPRSSSRSNGARPAFEEASEELDESILPDDSWFGPEESAEIQGAAEESAAAAVPLATAPPSQAFALAATPMYPSSVKWSEDNLLAVAAGHMVTILNPATLSGPRSFVSAVVRPSYDFGTVNRDELKHHMMLPLTLQRDSRPVVRSVDWSPQGVCSNGGCLLAVATTDYRVKIYAPPMAVYRSEWVEIMDLSDHMFDYCTKHEFLENEVQLDMMAEGLSPQMDSRCLKRQAPEQLTPVGDSLLKRRRVDDSGSAPGVSVVSLQAGNPHMLPSLTRPSNVVWDGQTTVASNSNLLPEDVIKIFQKQRGKGAPYGQQFAGADVEGFDTASKQNKRKKPLKTKDGNTSNVTILAPQYLLRSSILASLCLAFSPKVSYTDANNHNCVFVAAGTKAGMVGFWRIFYPGEYSVEKVVPPQDVCFLGFLSAHESWVTVLDWAIGDPGDHILLATGSSDGSVKLWQGDTRTLMTWQSSSQFVPWNLLIQVNAMDSIPVTSLALKLPPEAAKLFIAVGKSSGSVSTWELTTAGVCTRKAYLPRAHDQTIMGLCWTFDGCHFYSCGQDNMLQMWEFTDNELLAVQTSLLTSEVASAPDLPASALESFFGVALSPANLALAMVRGVAAEAVDPMYQSRSQKGVVQILWVGQDDTILRPDYFDDPTCGSRTAYSIAASWEARLVSGIFHFERHAKSFVLWDVLTVLSFLKGICGGEIIGTIIQKWLPTCTFVNTGASQICCWSTNELKACLPSMNTRCIQALVVIFRRIILNDLNMALFTEGLEAMYNNSASRSHLTHEQQLWLDILWCLEYELRERLMFLALLTALWCKSPQAENAQASGVMQTRLPTALIMSDWISLNSSKVSPQLLQLAIEVHKAYNRPSKERCTYCDQPVPLQYMEVGYCRPEGANTTRMNHRLQRCLTSMQICPSSASTWFCTCCGRNAFQQAPEFFFTLGSRLEIERLPSITVLLPVVPRCPFCGILLQRILPEFFLTPALV